MRTRMVVICCATCLGLVALIAGSPHLPRLFLRHPHADGPVRIDPHSVERPDRKRATVYVTLAPECPVCSSCIPKLNALHNEFERDGIKFVGVVPGAAATISEVEQFGLEFGLEFPVVRDARHQLCQQLGATHTPQALVVVRGEIIYSGRIDDQFNRIAGSSRTVRDQTLRNAIDGYINSRSIPVARTTPVGCLIEAPPEATPAESGLHADVVFSRDIAPILFNHCARCHRPGESAPFSLLTFDDARRHARQIGLVVQRRLMPPWKPAPNFGRFENEHRLSEQEIAMISTWIDSGCPPGSDEDMPQKPSFTAGWQLGEPDAELIMPQAFEVPADGPDVYQHFIIPSHLTEDHLIRAWEFRPGAAEVVHHSIVYFDTTGRGRELDAAEPGPGYSRVGTPGFVVSGSLGGWGPGGLPRELPVGMGRPLPENSDLVIQIHYHPNGAAARDRSRIGLYFADSTARQHVTEIIVADVGLEIPAGAEEHHHQAEWTLPVDTILISATPHMHTLGKKIMAVAHLPDGRAYPLIRIDDWDFYWQDSYVFDEVLSFPAGTRIVLDCWFDNSANNPLNPNSPPKTVFWGDFSDDEMAICYFQATTRNRADYVTLNASAVDYFQTMWKQYIAAKSLRESQ